MTKSQYTGMCCFCTTLLLCAERGNAQTGWPDPAAIQREEVELCGHIYLSSPRRIREAAASIPGLVSGKKWEEAARAIQVLLDAKNSEVIARKLPGQKVKEWPGANAVGQWWLAKLPAEGRAGYQKLYAQAARELFEKTAKDNNPQLLAEVTARYPITDAADKARELLAARASKARVFEPLKANLPLLDSPKWQKTTVIDEGSLPVARDEQTQRWIDRVLEAMTGVPFVPGGVPLVRDDLVVFRSYLGCVAITLRERANAPFIRNIKPGEIRWRSTDFDGSLTMLLNDSIKRLCVQPWFNYYLSNRHGALLLENQFPGAISADNKRVYAVDDLAVPPPNNPLRFPPLPAPPEIKAQVSQNSVAAFTLETGKITWGLGSGLWKEDAFLNSHFLGAPLCLETRLLLLNEKNNGELRLVWVDPEKVNRLHRPAVTHIEPVGVVEPGKRFLVNPRRRLSPVHLTAADGILVCSTHVGTVLGIDLQTRRLLWGYGYDAEAPKAKPGVIAKPGFINAGTFRVPEWKACSPFLHDGKVVFAAPDDPHVHCLNLRDGRLLWKVHRAEDDVYLAGVFGGRVLLVGKAACRALALKDGKPLWKIDTGIPSGLGAGSGDTYFLPLSKGATSKRPEVCAIDLARGQITARSESRKGEIPGNLVFHDGLVFSQTATTITAYPQKKSAVNRFK
jgi:outer membrane protein assembly factor BamB